MNISGGGGSHQPQPKPTEKELIATAYLQAVKKVFQEQGQIEKLQQFLRLLKDFKFKRTADPADVIHSAQQLFQGHPDLLLGFNAFVPKEFQITLLPPPQNHPPPHVTFHEAISFINKIKIRFQGDRDHNDDDDHVYESFLNILSRYIKEKQPTTSNTSSESESTDDDDHEAALVIFHEVAALFKYHPDLLLEFTHFLPSAVTETVKHNLSAVTPTATTVTPKNFSSSDYDDDEEKRSCTPSYTLLPEDSQNPIASRRTELDSRVLNDRCVQRITATTSAGGYGSSTMHTSQSEEILFRCEEDRFELDMFLESMNSTAQRVEQLLEKIDRGTIDDDQIRLEDHFKSINLRCIEQLYGEWGLEVMDALREKETAAVALPVILNRLKLKQQEWETCRSDFNQVWAQVYANNLSKKQSCCCSNNSAPNFESPSHNLDCIKVAYCSYRKKN